MTIRILIVDDESLIASSLKVFLEDEGFAAREELEGIEKDVEKEIEEAIDFADRSPWPKPEEAFKDIFVSPYY